MPALLDFLELWIPERMTPGTVFLLGTQAGRGGSLHGYAAALSCPRCGTVGLITNRQLHEGEPMICGDPSCSAEFQLNGEELRYRKPQ